MIRKWEEEFFLFCYCVISATIGKFVHYHSRREKKNFIRRWNGYDKPIIIDTFKGFEPFDILMKVFWIFTQISSTDSISESTKYPVRRAAPASLHSHTNLFSSKAQHHEPKRHTEH